MSKPEWKQYPAEVKPGSEIDVVSHITTPDAAARIVADRKIRALLSDNEKGGCEAPVVWMSPNVYPESKFGTVKFDFSFSELIHERAAYWVPNAGEIICQILITKREQYWAPNLTKYDPKKAGGPWFQDGDRHYWHRDACVRLLFDEDIDVCYSDAAFKKLTLTNADSCVEGPRDRLEAGALFLGRLLCLSNMPAMDCPRLLNNEQTCLTPALAAAVSTMVERIESPRREEAEKPGRVGPDCPEAPILAHKLLTTPQKSHVRHFSEFHKVVSMFESPSAAAEAIKKLIKKRFVVEMAYEPSPNIDDLSDE
jgi:hypothetical protein